MSDEQPVVEEGTPDIVASAETTEVTEAAADPEVVVHSADAAEELSWCVYNSSA